MRTKTIISSAAAVAIAAAAAVSGCGGSSNTTTSVNPNAAEVSPAGDIPDNQAFVPYTPPGGGFSVKVPEGWSRTSSAGGGVTFTDKLNSVTIESTRGPALTDAAAQAQVVPQLAKTTPGFASPQVSTVTRSAGDATLIAYDASGRPDPVTGKSTLDSVQRYTFSHNGEQVTLTLSGAKGADNVDPWRIITDSLRFTQ